MKYGREVLKDFFCYVLTLANYRKTNTCKSLDLSDSAKNQYKVNKSLVHTEKIVIFAPN